MPSVVASYVVIGLVTECHDWSCSFPCFYICTHLVSLIDSTLSSVVLSPDLIYLFFKNLSEFSLILYSLFFIQFKSLFQCYSLHLNLKDGERFFQKYDWLGSDLEQNNLGRYIQINPMVWITPACMMYPYIFTNQIDIKISTFFIEVITIDIYELSFSASVWYSKSWCKPLLFLI